MNTLRHFTGISEPAVFNPRGTSQTYSYRRGMGMIASAEFDVFFDDFNKAVATNVPSGWAAAVIDTGATLTLDTTAGTVGATGGALIASDGTSEGVAIYITKGIQLTTGKRFFMEVLAQGSIAAEVDLQFGLTDLTATTNPEDLWTTTAENVVAFGLLAGSAYPTMLSDKSDSGTAAQAQTAYALSNATYAKLAIYYDGANLSGWVNGNQALLWSGAASTVPTGVALAPFIGGRTGATAANTVNFDYIRYVIER